MSPLLPRYFPLLRIKDTVAALMSSNLGKINDDFLLLSTPLSGSTYWETRCLLGYIFAPCSRERSVRRSKSTSRYCPRLRLTAAGSASATFVGIVGQSFLQTMDVPERHGTGSRSLRQQQKVQEKMKHNLLKCFFWAYWV
jgi:hypothetical protein